MAQVNVITVKVPTELKKKMKQLKLTGASTSENVCKRKLTNKKCLLPPPSSTKFDTRAANINTRISILDPRGQGEIATPRYIVDASVVIKWVLWENHHLSKMQPN